MANKADLKSGKAVYSENHDWEGKEDGIIDWMRTMGKAAGSLNVSLTVRDRLILNALAGILGISVTEVIRRALEFYLDTNRRIGKQVDANIDSYKHSFRNHAGRTQIMGKPLPLPAPSPEKLAQFKREYEEMVRPPDESEMNKL